MMQAESQLGAVVPPVRLIFFPVFEYSLKHNIPDNIMTVSLDCAVKFVHPRPTSITDQAKQTSLWSESWHSITTVRRRTFLMDDL